MSMMHYRDMFVDIYVKYYDEEKETIMKRRVPLEIALLMIENMLAIKKLQWVAYGSQCMNKHFVEWVRIE